DPRRRAGRGCDRGGRGSAPDPGFRRRPLARRWRRLARRRLAWRRLAWRRLAWGWLARRRLAWRMGRRPGLASGLLARRLLVQWLVGARDRRGRAGRRNRHRPLLGWLWLRGRRLLAISADL